MRSLPAKPCFSIALQFKVRDRVVWWLTLPHEAVHYLVARLLGVRAVIYPARIVFQHHTNWKTALITAAPLAVGLLAWGASLAGWVLFARTLEEHAFWSCVAWVCFWWNMACALDVRNLLWFARTGQWVEIAQEKIHGRENVERR